MDSTPRLVGYPVDRELIRLEARASASRRARRERRAEQEHQAEQEHRAEHERQAWRERRAEQQAGWRHWLLSPWRSGAQTRS